MIEVRAGIALSIEFTRADIPWIGCAKERREFILVGGLLAAHSVIVIIETIVLLALELVHEPSLFERILGVYRGSHGALVDLLEVRFTRNEFGGRNIEGHGPGGEPKVIHMGLGGGGEREDLVRAGNQFVDFRNRAAVNLLDAFVNGIHIRQHGVG